MYWYLHTTVVGPERSMKPEPGADKLRGRWQTLTPLKLLSKENFYLYLLEKS